MRKSIFYTVIGIVVVFVAVCAFFLIHQSSDPIKISNAKDYSRLKVKKAKAKKFRKLSGKIFKCKKDEKLYAIFKRYKDSSRPKELMCIFTKDSFSNNNVIHPIKDSVRNRKPGIIFNDIIDVNSIIKKKEKTFYNNGIIMGHDNTDSLLEYKFK